MNRANRFTGPLLAALCLLHVVLSVIGLSWGLPSRASDRYLFSGEPWASEAIAGASARPNHSPIAGTSDNPALMTAAKPFVLNATRESIGETYARYRLGTRHPEEWSAITTLPALKRRDWEFDYASNPPGGLYRYPVGACIRICGALGLYPVVDDIAHYISTPDDLAKIYLTARAYTCAWGILGILVMFGIGRRVGDWNTGILSALLFCLLPVVICTAHEAQPHLPSAVLTLAACLFGMRALDLQRTREWAGLFICTGAAVATAFHTVPIVLLIPLIIGLHCRAQSRRQNNELPDCSNRRVNYVPVFFRATLGGWLVAGAVYLVSNPYDVVHLFDHRTTTTGGMLAMFNVRHPIESLLRAVRLTGEGMTPPIALLGLAGAYFAIVKRKVSSLPLAVVTGMFAIQFDLMAADTPDAFARYGIVVDCALTIAGAVTLLAIWKRARIVGFTVGVFVISWSAYACAGYLSGFRIDAANTGAVEQASAYLRESAPGVIAVTAPPAPSTCPPIDFEHTQVFIGARDPREQTVDLVRRWNSALREMPDETPETLVTILNDPEVRLTSVANRNWKSAKVFGQGVRYAQTRMSWANRPVVILSRAVLTSEAPAIKQPRK